MTCPFLGTVLIAVRQSVGRGWRPGGTPSIQTRHIPAGGRCPGGILAFPPHCAAAGAAAPRDASAAKAMIFLIRESPPVRWCALPKGTHSAAAAAAGLGCSTLLRGAWRSSRPAPELKHDHPCGENQDADPRASRLLNDRCYGDSPAGEDEQES